MLKELKINEMEMVSGGAGCPTDDEECETPDSQPSPSGGTDMNSYGYEDEVIVTHPCTSCHDTYGVNTDLPYYTTNGGTSSPVMAVGDAFDNPGNHVAHAANVVTGVIVAVGTALANSDYQPTDPFDTKLGLKGAN